MRFLHHTHTLRASVLLLGVAVAGCIGTPADPAADEDVNPSHGEALTMSDCGTVIGTFDGTDAYSNSYDTGSGASCGGKGPYGSLYQCVELTMRHFKTHWDVQWWGNARDLLDKAPRDKVDVFDNGDGAHPPVPGDMIVWKNGAYGHAALVTAVHPDGIDILEQNVKGDSTATLPWDGATIGPRWNNWVPAGWAHAKANDGHSHSGGTGDDDGGSSSSSSSSGHPGGSSSSSSSSSGYPGGSSSSSSGHPGGSSSGHPGGSSSSSSSGGSSGPVPGSVWPL